MFLLLGVLALALALGHRRRETDQGGALQELTRHAGGTVLLTLVAVGLAVYALWQLTRIITGDGGSERLDAIVSSIANGLLSASAVTVLLAGHASSQPHTQVEWTARVMRHEGGRWLVGLVGVVVAVVAVVMAVRGLRRGPWLLALVAVGLVMFGLYGLAEAKYRRL